MKKIDYHWEQLLKAKVIENIIPPRLNEDVHFDSLNRLNTLNQAMYRAMLMWRFICEKQMPNVGTMFGGGGEEEMLKKAQFVRMMITLANQAVMLINAAQRIVLCVSNMSVEQYVKATTTLMAWKKFEAINEIMGEIIERLKDENLSLIFDTSGFEGHIRAVAELHVKIEKIFVDKSPEELAQESKVEGSRGDQYQLTQAQLERQKLVQHCHKLDLRHQGMRMAVAVMALQVFLGGVLEGGSAVNHTFVKKATLVYGRLVDVIFKLDHIDCEDTGKEYLNLAELVTDKRLLEKYDVIKVIWSEMADSEQIQTKDWTSLLEAVQRDLTQLFNDYKFKRLVKHIESTYKEQNRDVVSIDEIFYIDRFKNETLPWIEISKKIRTDIQHSESLKDKIETLEAKNREGIKKNLEQERALATQKVGTKSLEQRLVQAQTKIEELNSAKAEAERAGKEYDAVKKRL